LAYCTYFSKIERGGRLGERKRDEKEAPATASPVGMSEDDEPLPASLSRQRKSRKKKYQKTRAKIRKMSNDFIAALEVFCNTSSLAHSHSLSKIQSCGLAPWL
jgi:hypothetical protein